MATLSAQHDDDSPSCFNTIPWHKQRIYNRGTTGKKKYTDADLAADMNALSFKERSEVEEDIHGVSNVIPETDEFVDAKIKELKESLKNMPRSANRIAWDRACFLRPSLETDRAHYLMFLRARRFVAFDAATLLLKFYEIKEELWGESMVMQRITWRDLNAQEQEFAKRGVYQFLTKRDSTGRAIGYHRVRQYDLRNSRNNALVKSFIYLYLAGLQANPEVQKRGVVSIVDFRGTEPKMDMDADVAPYFASISHIGDR